MNWNGKKRNGVLGGVSACRESVAKTKQRGSIEGAEWLLEPVDPNSAALISLIAPLNRWADAVPEDEREKWLVRMMIHRPIEIRQWMGYAEDWTMMPAEVCRKHEEVVRLAHTGKLPGIYLIPATPRQSDAEKVGAIKLDNGWMVNGVKLATVTYVLMEGEWYKAYSPKLPSQSAVSRAIRLYLLGILLGRTLTSTKELRAYEMGGLKMWMSYGSMGEQDNGLAKHASDTLFHLLTEPEIEEQLDG